MTHRVSVALVFALLYLFPATGDPTRMLSTASPSHAPESTNEEVQSDTNELPHGVRES